MRWTMIALLGAACLDPGVVELQGVLLEGWEPGAAPAADATLLSLDEYGAEVDRFVTQDDGWFRVEALAGGRSFLVAEGSGLVPSGFSGLSGLNPRQRLPNGSVYTVPEGDWQTEAASWEGCPGLDDAGVVFGEVQVLGFETEGSPVRVTTGEIRLVTEAGVSLEACYLDEAGSYDPAQTQTGVAARFLIPGVPEGRHSLQLDWVPIEGFEESVTYDVWMPEDGLAPRYPLFVTFDATN